MLTVYNTIRMGHSTSRSSATAEGPQDTLY